MTRPRLAVGLSTTTFRKCYWLKAELMDFCQAQGLPVSGSKEQLAERIARFLETGVGSPRPAGSPVAARQMEAPGPLSRQTVITPALRCNHVLRAFIEAELGPGFHVNSLMRVIVNHGQGRTLGEVMDAWRRERIQPRPRVKITPQQEYQRHMRDFFRAYPDKTLDDAIAAWRRRHALTHHL